MTKSRKLLYFQIAFLAALCVIGWFTFKHMFEYTLVFFNSPIEDMAHGYVVPFVSIYVIWKQRTKWKEAIREGNGSFAGLFWMIVFLTTAFFGHRGGQARIEQVAFIGLVWSAPYAVWGKTAGRLMAFPAAYLLFTVPVSSFLDFFTIHLRIFSTAMATWLLNGLGIAVERSGTALFSRQPGGEFNVDVADPCSGIRSLVALMALTAAYGYFFVKGWWRKCLLFACSVPIAMLGNMVRIMSICIVAAWFGQEKAMGYYHDYSGYATFLIGILLVVAIGNRLDKDEETAQKEEKPLAQLKPRTGWCVCTLALGATVLWTCATMRHVETVYENADFIATKMPESVGEYAGDTPWFCHNDQCLDMEMENSLRNKPELKTEDGWKCPSCGKPLHTISLGEQNDLPDDTKILKRHYTAPDGLTYSVSIVLAGRRRNSIHRAELCLPAQGYSMQQAGKQTFTLSSGMKVKVRSILAVKTGRTPFSLLYWFESRERRCCSHTERIVLDIWDRSIRNRINRWAMIALNVSSPVDSPEAAARLEEFLSALFPQIVFSSPHDK